MPRSLPAVLALAVFFSAPGWAADKPPSDSPDYWSPLALLPCYTRGVARRVTSGDGEAVEAEVRGWMEEYGGRPVGGNGPGASRWILPAGELGNFDSFLDSQGKVHMLASHAPAYSLERPTDRGASDGVKAESLKMIDAGLVRRQRDGLRRDLEKLEGRGADVPAVLRLSRAYLQSLDEVDDALDRYRAAVAVEVHAVRETDPIPNDRRMFSFGGGAALLPQGCERLRWDEARYPDPSTTVEDSLMWRPARPRWLRDAQTLRVTVEVEDLDAAVKALEKDLRAIGAKPSVSQPWQARVASDRLMNRYFSTHTKGYWVPRGALDALRAAALVHGRVRGWDRVKAGEPAESDPLLAWANALERDLRTGREALADLPYVRSLARSQTTKLAGYTESEKMLPTAELVALVVAVPTKPPSNPSSSFARRSAVGEGYMGETVKSHAPPPTQGPAPVVQPSPPPPPMNAGPPPPPGTGVTRP